MAFLISSFEEVKQAGVPVSRNFTLTPFDPYLRSIWSELFPQFLGRVFTELLETAWTASTLTPQQTALLPYLRRPLCQLAFAQYLPFAEVQLADDGITVSASTERKPATERQIIALRKTLLESGWKSLENLLAYLDFHQVDFPAYVTFRDAQQLSLLPTAGEFTKYYQIFGSRLTYQALKPTADLLETDVLIPLLGDRWPGILTSTDIADRTLCRHARTWLATKTIAEAIPSLAIEVSGNGLKVHYTASIDNIEYVNPPTEAQLTRLIDKVTLNAETAWQTLNSLLNNTPDGEQGRGLMDNEGRKIIFF